MSSEPSERASPITAQPRDVFERTVDEGERRLERKWLQLCATGAVGGIDVSIGVLALLVVHDATGDELLAALAFSIGFVALTLANSELFTENFLVPIAALAAGRSSWTRLVRLWIVTLVFNLAGGWVMTGLVISGIPRLRPAARTVAAVYPAMGIGWRSFALAMLAGAAITLMTWMTHSSASAPAQLVGAIAIAFLLAAAPLNHAIVVSLEMFAALHAGAPFAYADWASVLGWATLGNIIGGVCLVTVLRLMQVGPEKIEEERARENPATDLVVVGGSEDV
jgi:formate/nitrite transporter FocA (FNT family)